MPFSAPAQTPSRGRSAATRVKGGGGVVLIPRCAGWGSGTEAHAGEGLPPSTLHASIWGWHWTKTSRASSPGQDGYMHCLLPTDHWVKASKLHLVAISFNGLWLYNLYETFGQRKKRENKGAYSIYTSCNTMVDDWGAMKDRTNAQQTHTRFRH